MPPAVKKKTDFAKETKRVVKKSPSKKNPHSKFGTKSIKKIDNCLYQVSLPGEDLYLVGTAHVSKASSELVEQVINKYKPTRIYLELDEERKKALLETKFKEINLIQIIKTKKLAFFIVYLVLSIFQKKISEKTGSIPGGEFKKAMELATEKKVPISLVDREANITIRRLWRKMTLKEQFKFIFSFFGGGEAEESELDEVEQIEKLKESDALSDMINKLGEQFPTIKRVMIDERDLYMSEMVLSENLKEEKEKITTKNSAQKTKTGKKGKGVVVVGAGHLTGMLKFFEDYLISLKDKMSKKNKESNFVRPDMDAIREVPPAHGFWKVFPWGFMAIILAIFTIGFFITDDPLKFKDALIYWVLANGSLSALGGVIALAHPLTILICFIAAPITSLNPMIGAGMVTSLVQTILVPPQIKDFENFKDDMSVFRRWWKNRITKVLLVFIFSSLGSAVGTWVGIPMIISAFS